MGFPPYEALTTSLEAKRAIMAQSLREGSAVRTCGDLKLLFDCWGGVDVLATLPTLGFLRWITI